MKNQYSQELRNTQDLIQIHLVNFDYVWHKDQSFDTLKQRVHSAIRKNVISDSHNAMEYLTVHDTGLELSLKLADLAGYQPIDLASTILATLLCQDKLHNDWLKREGTINSLIKKYRRIQTKLTKAQNKTP